MKIEKVRLQKYMAECGVASRRKSEELIAGGFVKVNGRKASIGDQVTVSYTHLIVLVLFTNAFDYILGFFQNNVFNGFLWVADLPFRLLGLPSYY